uniref:Uncharacterized protein n=1 Tax=Musca domestica TaxID=7370 RepID=T1PAK4_MUSDO
MTQQQQQQHSHWDLNTAAVVNTSSAPSLALIHTPPPAHPHNPAQSPTALPPPPPLMVDINQVPLSLSLRHAEPVWASICTTYPAQPPPPPQQPRLAPCHLHSIYPQTFPTQPACNSHPHAQFTNAASFPAGTLQVAQTPQHLAAATAAVAQQQQSQAALVAAATVAANYQNSTHLTQQQRSDAAAAAVASLSLDPAGTHHHHHHHSQGVTAVPQLQATSIHLTSMSAAAAAAAAHHSHSMAAAAAAAAMSSHHQQQQQQTASLKQKLNKSQQITRSLDENAFIREFGNKNLQELKSSQQLTQQSANEAGNRRKSFDFTRPKTLNPPKRLPGMPITEEYCASKANNDKTTLKIDLPKEKNFNNTLEHDYETADLKITPTTENRISLIQNNVHPENTADLNNSNISTSPTNTGNGGATTPSTNLKVLSGVKLDRERIDRIKEERRQQLTQKYHADSFKSKSKTDLNLTKNEDDKFSPDNTSLRVKSKSRADMRTLQKDMDNLKEFGRNPPSSAVSETTLNTQHRVRSISDEKNQNSYDQTNANNAGDGGGGGDSFIKRSQHSLNRGNTTKPTSTSSTASSGGMTSADQEEFSARATVQKFERKSMDFANGVNSTTPLARERSSVKSTHELGSTGLSPAARNSISSNREKISPQFSIRDVTAMFESRSQNQQ